MSSRNLFKIYVIGGAMSWLLLLIIDLMKKYFIENSISITIPTYVSQFFLSTFVLLMFLSFKIEIGKKKNSNFIENLWQVFIIGGFTILVSLLIKFFLLFSHKAVFSHNSLFLNFLYHLNIGLIAIFLANGFYVWKKMILYQKSKIMDIGWRIFEILVFISLVTNFIVFNDFFNIKFILASLPITVLGLVLSFNLKWVAFLNYKQKWQSILLIFLIIVICCTFLQQIFEQKLSQTLVIDLSTNIFTLAIFAFMLLNCFSALLVLLFNLPTSSVFEQKFGEVMIFQKLSQSIQMGDKEEEVYDILLESSFSTVIADGGWLEIVDQRGKYKAFIKKEISEYDVYEIKKVLRKNNVNIQKEPQYVREVKKYEYTEKIKDLPFNSMLLIPLMSNNQRLGSLALMKNNKDGFDKEMVDIICSFVSQASVAIKNFRLVNEAIENERYKEELKIAKEVQKSLFPQNLFINSNIDMAAFTKSADEVGGDYYDLFEYANNKIAIVIGDVSGNGTSAAFNMAQMKGVFQSLIQLELPPDQFMNYANTALSRCLEKTSFITLSLFVIDLKNQMFQFARAGHCPALLYSKKDKDSFYLKSKGLGLGIIRSKDYAQHIEKQDYSYNKGDVMLLYSDGIVEAFNGEREEYGYENLKLILNEHNELPAKKIGEKITEDLYKYTGTKELNDDYTFLVLKFL